MIILYNRTHVYETLWQLVQYSMRYYPWKLLNNFKWFRTAFAEGFMLSMGIDMSVESKNFYLLVIIFPHGIIKYFILLVNSNIFGVLVTIKPYTKK